MGLDSPDHYLSALASSLSEDQWKNLLNCVPSFATVTAVNAIEVEAAPASAQVNACWITDRVSNSTNPLGSCGFGLLKGQKTKTQVQDFAEVQLNIELWISPTGRYRVMVDLHLVMDGHHSRGDQVARLVAHFFPSIFRYSFYREAIHHQLMETSSPLDKGHLLGRLEEVLKPALRQSFPLMHRLLAFLSSRPGICAEPSLMASGCTMACVLICDSAAYVAHVGDCRVYLLEEKAQANEKPVQIQWPFSPIQPSRCVPDLPLPVENSDFRLTRLTRDHKAEDPIEIHRIQRLAHEKPELITFPPLSTPKNSHTSDQDESMTMLCMRSDHEKGLKRWDMRFFTQLRQKPGPYWLCQEFPSLDQIEITDPTFDPQIPRLFFGPRGLGDTLAVARALGDSDVKLELHNLRLGPFVSCEPEITVVHLPPHFASTSGRQDRSLRFCGFLLTSDGAINSDFETRVLAACAVHLSPWIAELRAAAHQSVLMNRRQFAVTSALKEAVNPSLVNLIRQDRQNQQIYPSPELTDSCRSQENPRVRQEVNFCQAADRVIADVLFTVDPTTHQITSPQPPYFDDCVCLLAKWTLPNCCEVETLAQQEFYSLIEEQRSSLLSQ